MKGKVPYYLLAIVTLLLLGLFITSLLGARSSQEILPRAEAGVAEKLTLRDLRVRGGLPAYWLGEETYQGLRVVDIQHVWDPGSPDGARPPQEYISIIYSSCRIGQPEEGAPAEGYCAPDESPTYLEVRSEWLCLKPPPLLEKFGLPLQARGAQVYKVPSGDIHFTFGTSTVIIFASEGEEAALDAFDHLVGVNPPGLAIAATARSQLGPSMADGQCENFTLPTPLPTVTPEPTATPKPTATPESTIASIIPSAPQGGS